MISIPLGTQRPTLIVSVPSGGRLPAGLALPRGQDLDPDVLLSSHTEISSWTMTVCSSSRFLPNPSPILTTWGYSIETHLSSFFVAASCSLHDPLKGEAIIPYLWVDSSMQLWWDTSAGALLPHCSHSNSSVSDFIPGEGQAQIK